MKLCLDLSVGCELNFWSKLSKLMTLTVLDSTKGCPNKCIGTSGTYMYQVPKFGATFAFFQRSLQLTHAVGTYEKNCDIVPS